MSVWLFRPLERSCCLESFCFFPLNLRVEYLQVITKSYDCHQLHKVFTMAVTAKTAKTKTLTFL